MTMSATKTVTMPRTVVVNDAAFADRLQSARYNMIQNMYANNYWIRQPVPVNRWKIK